MKKVWGAMAIFFICYSLNYAQEKIGGVGGGVGTNFLIGDSPVMDSKISPNFGLYGVFGITKNIDLKFQVGFGQFSINSLKKKYTTSFMPIELQGLYSMFPTSKFNPFVQFGVGAMRFSINSSPNYYDGMAIGGVGFKYVVNPSWTWLVSANMRYTTGDDFNGNIGGMKDGYFNLQYGLTYNLKKDDIKYERKDQFKEKEILAQHYMEQHEVLLKTQLENIRIEIKKLEQEITYLNKMVGVHITNVDNFSNNLYNFALNIGQEEKVKVLAVKREDDQ